MSTQPPKQHDTCGVCSSCTNRKKPMTNEQQATVHYFNIYREKAYIKSLSPEERNQYYKTKAKQQEFLYSLFINGSINGSKRGSFKRF